MAPATRSQTPRMPRSLGLTGPARRCELQAPKRREAVYSLNQHDRAAAGQRTVICPGVALQPRNSTAVVRHAPVSRDPPSSHTAATRAALAAVAHSARIARGRPAVAPVVQRRAARPLRMARAPPASAALAGTVERRVPGLCTGACFAHLQLATADNAGLRQEIAHLQAQMQRADEAVDASQTALEALRVTSRATSSSPPSLLRPANCLCLA